MNVYSFEERVRDGRKPGEKGEEDKEKKCQAHRETRRYIDREREREEEGGQGEGEKEMKYWQGNGGERAARRGGKRESSTWRKWEHKTKGGRWEATWEATEDKGFPCKDTQVWRDGNGELEGGEWRVTGHTWEIESQVDGDGDDDGGINICMAWVGRHRHTHTDTGQGGGREAAVHMDTQAQERDVRAHGRGRLQEQLACVVASVCVVCEVAQHTCVCLSVFRGVACCVRGQAEKRGQ